MWSCFARKFDETDNYYNQALLSRKSINHAVQNNIQARLVVMQ